MRPALALLWVGFLAACAPPGGPAAPAGSSASRDIAHEADLARGGRLYDEWYAEIEAKAPTLAHPAYPPDAGFASRPGATWRCKECHGWDYRGKNGAYASGAHATGIRGIIGAGGDVTDVQAALRDSTHVYGTLLTDRDVRHLALFVAEGARDTDGVIDRDTGRARGDAARGAVHFANLCAGCHGPDGRADDMPVLGALSRENPWEALHKIRNGQPGTAMPALRALDPGVTRDVLTHCQSLPGE